MNHKQPSWLPFKSDLRPLGWQLTSLLIASVVMLPLMAVILSWFTPFSEHWSHFFTDNLGKLLVNSGLLLVVVSCLTAFVGVSLGWFVSQFNFPGRRFFRIALILPLTLPAYVTGFVYLGLFEYAGPFFTALRALGIDSFFEIKSLGGAGLTLSFALFPYVFILSEQGFSSLSSRYFEAAGSLGYSRLKTFFGLALPMVRPWLFLSLSLVAMETLADFGTVSIFVVDTFTTAIYKAWYGFYSISLAAQLASTLLLFIIGLLWLESRQRKNRTYAGKLEYRRKLIELRGRRAYLVCSFCSLVFLFSFFIPFFQLLFWTFSIEHSQLDKLVAAFWRSLVIGLLAASCVAIVSVLLVFAKRFYPNRLLRAATRISLLGYALPGAVLAVGLYFPLAAADNWFADLVSEIFGTDPGLLLTGSIVTLVLGLTIRYLAVGHANVDAALERVSPRLDEAAQNFGSVGWAQIKFLHFPLIKSALTAAFVLTFVDVVKEMPLTLMTRPFGWDTLAVKIFEYISEGEWEMAALPSLLLALLGLLVMLVFKKKEFS